MLLVVNPNPAIDRIAVVDFRRGSTIRPISYLEWPGGSGVHSAHVARRLGAKAEVVAMVGGHYGRRFRELAEDHGLVVHAVESEVETRGTYSIIDRHDGNICDIAEGGQLHETADASRLLSAFDRASFRAGLVVLSGSLPPGIPSSIYRNVVGLCHERGLRVIADLTGEALMTTLDSSPWMVKPSLEELQRDGVVGAGGGNVLDTAKSWLDRGVQHVCISLAAEGVLWVSSEGTRRVWISPEPAFNTIGAGDTLVGATAAAVLAGRDLSFSLRQGVAAATANLRHVEPGDCSQEEVAALLPEVQIDDVDARALAGLLG